MGHIVVGVDLSHDAEITADITTLDWDDAGIGEIDGAIHLAAKTSVPESILEPDLYHKTNVLATERLFDWCVKTGVPTVVFASSAAVYGDSATSVKRVGSEGKLASPYAENKRQGEMLAEKLSSKVTNFVCLRFFNVYGAGQPKTTGYSAVIPAFIQKQLDCEDLTIHGDGEQTRDFVNVNDVSKAIYGSLTQKISNFKIINVGTGMGISLKNLSEMVTSISVRHGINPSRVVHTPSRIGDVMHSVADLGDLNLILNIDNMIPLEEGIEAQFLLELESMKEKGTRGNRVARE